MKIRPVIEVVPYNPNWPRSYEAEAEKIEGMLGTNCVKIYHIGSTAVPGLAAKPIIDIMIVVKDILEIDSQLAAFEGLGYTAKGEHGIPFRRYFYKGDDMRTHNIHVYEEGSVEIDRHIHFREYLKTNPDVSQEYESLKMALAKQYPNDINAYSNGKDAFIHEIDQKANLNKLRIVVACTAREWKSVKQFRCQHFLETGSDALFETTHHSHIILFQGVAIIGYADISLTPPGYARIVMLVLKVGCESAKDEFMSMLERWLLHQGRKVA